MKKTAFRNEGLRSLQCETKATTLPTHKYLTAKAERHKALSAGSVDGLIGEKNSPDGEFRASGSCVPTPHGHALPRSLESTIPLIIMSLRQLGITLPEKHLILLPDDSTLPPRLQEQILLELVHLPTAPLRHGLQPVLARANAEAGALRDHHARMVHGEVDDRDVDDVRQAALAAAGRAALRGVPADAAEQLRAGGVAHAEAAPVARGRRGRKALAEDGRAQRGQVQLRDGGRRRRRGGARRVRGRVARLVGRVAPDADLLEAQLLPRLAVAAGVHGWGWLRARCAGGAWVVGVAVVEGGDRDGWWLAGRGGGERT